MYVSDQSHAVVRCPKLWWLLWAIITFQLTQATSPWILSKNSSTPSVPWVLNHLIRLFSVDFSDKAAPAEVMGCLRCCNLVSLDLSDCFDIPAAAWQQLRGATWRNLKKAHFAECLARERNSWKVFLFCSLLERVRVGVIFWKLLYELALDGFDCNEITCILCELVVIGS